MAETINVATGIVGMNVLDVETGQSIGSVTDIIVDPARGELLGYLVKGRDSVMRAVAWHEATLDSVALLTRVRALQRRTKLGDAFTQSVRAIRKMVGASVITDMGKLLGTISEVHFAPYFRKVSYRLKQPGIKGFFGGTLLLPGDAPHVYSSPGNRLILPSGSEEKYTTDDAPGLIAAGINTARTLHAGLEPYWLAIWLAMTLLLIGVMLWL